MAAPAPPSIDALAQQLGPRKGVLWAVESSKVVSSKTHPADQSATGAAEAWVKNPNPSTQAGATSAAKKTDFQGPGAWAAQAAAWAHPSGGNAPAGAAGMGASQTPPAPGASAPSSAGGHAAATGAPGPLVSAAVAGSVALSAALFAGVKPPTGKTPTAPNSPAAPQAGKPGIPKFPASTKPPAPPPPTAAELAKITKIQKPFIDLGQKILLDKSLFAKG